MYTHGYITRFLDGRGHVEHGNPDLYLHADFFLLDLMIAFCSVGSPDLLRIKQSKMLGGSKQTKPAKLEEKKAPKRYIE